MADFFNNYDLGGFYDEMFSAPGVPRPHYRQLMERYGEMSGIGEMFTRQKAADETFINRGVTFTVYSDQAGTEKIFPFDLIPRIIATQEWADNVSRILDIKYFMILPDRHHVGSALDVIQWGSVLRSCSAFEAFRRTQRGQLKLENVTDYLIRDTEFPRSILASITAAENCLLKISSDKENPLKDVALKEISELRKQLESCGIKVVLGNGLHEFLDDIQSQDRKSVV